MVAAKCFCSKLLEFGKEKDVFLQSHLVVDRIKFDNFIKWGKLIWNMTSDTLFNPTSASDCPDSATRSFSMTPVKGCKCIKGSAKKRI